MAGLLLNRILLSRNLSQAACNDGARAAEDPERIRGPRPEELQDCSADRGNDKGKEHDVRRVQGGAPGEDIKGRGGLGALAVPNNRIPVQPVLRKRPEGGAGATRRVRLRTSKEGINGQARHISRTSEFSENS